MHANAGVCRSPSVHLWVGFFFQGGHDDLFPVSAGRLEQQEWEAPVTGDQAKSLGSGGHCLFQHSALRVLNEVDQVGNVFAADGFRFEALNGLGGIQF